MNFKEGVILGINKPYRMSSFGALAHIRYVLSKHLGYKVKIGQASIWSILLIRNILPLRLPARK